MGRVNPPQFSALTPGEGRDEEGWEEAKVLQWGKGAVEGCGSHRPFHHPDTETMATVPKVTRGAERGEACG